MDYITNSLDTKINLLKSYGKNQKRELALYYQVRLEYLLIFITAYLWNKNLDKIEISSREFVIDKIQRPTIGDIISICRKLDIEKEIFGISKVNQSIQNYPNIRNSFLGHGYTFDDGLDELLGLLNQLYIDITSKKPSRSNILNEKFDLVVVTNFENGNFNGARYLSAERTYTPWICSQKVFDFQINNVYATHGLYDYFRLSPFIDIDGNEKIFIYSCIEERLLGQAKYNQIFETSNFLKEWEDFAQLTIEMNQSKRKSSNGTILNKFENNYKKYIPLKIKEKLRTFLIENKASVCATVWGHGGVGKTATVQSICEDLSKEEKYKKQFNYIIFLTAKDRKFNFENGEIEEIFFDERVDSLESILQKVNQILFDEPLTDFKKVKYFEGRLLLVLDDFETFSAEEKPRIIDFINQLNINHHKVIITTRADIRIGDQLQTNELSEEETLEFLREIIPIEFSNKIDIAKFDETFKVGDRHKQVYEITSGRPIFIFQFAHLYAAHQHEIDKILQYNLRSYSSAVKFLYERIYDYLSDDAKRVFVILAKLVVIEDDLSHVLGKAKYVLNWEHEEERFNNAVDELIKLKIIEVKESDIYHIYSKEIWQIMLNYYKCFPQNTKELWEDRLVRVGREKNPVEQALLIDADKTRLFGDEKEVTEAYNRVLTRVNCSKSTKLLALLNLGEYLFNDLGKKADAINTFTGYIWLFNDECIFIKMYATYLWSSSEIGTDDNLKANRYKAIKVLLEHLAKELNLNDNLSLEMFAMLITFQATYYLTNMEDLKTKLDYKEIRSSQYRSECKHQLEKLAEVQEHGQMLFDSARQINFVESKIPTSIKTRIITALLHCVEICEKLNKLEEAENICLFAFSNFKDSFTQHFYERFKKIYVSQNKSEHKAYEIYKNRVLQGQGGGTISINETKLPKTRDVLVIKKLTLKKPGMLR